MQKCTAKGPWLSSDTQAPSFDVSKCVLSDELYNKLVDQRVSHTVQL